MRPAVLVFRYAAFAAVATIANLGTQRAVLGVLGAAQGYVPGVFLGTAVGLFLKYVLDKYWIFSDREASLAGDSRKFLLYSAMGVITTLIFWGSETAFWLIWETHAMREVGAVLGLVVGYVIKYRLDRRFVFGAARTGAGSSGDRHQD